MALSGALIEDTDGLESIRAEWDALAVARGRPYCAPAWMLAWWHHVGRGRGELRAVAVGPASHLAALAPFSAEPPLVRRPRYRVLAADMSHRVEPLAAVGREREAAEVIARTLADARPRPAVIQFESVDQRIEWPALLAASWPGAGTVRVQRAWSGPAPTVRLADKGDFEAWLGSRSRNFRSQSRRRRRQLEELGARVALARTREEIEPALGRFAALHYERWRERGGSTSLSPEIESMLLEAGRELVA